MVRLEYGEIPVRGDIFITVIINIDYWMERGVCGETVVEEGHEEKITCKMKENIQHL